MIANKSKKKGRIVNEKCLSLYIGNLINNINKRDMTKEITAAELVALVASVQNSDKRICFRDINGRTNKISFYRGEESDRFYVHTLVYSTSIYWSDSDMSYEYIMSILDEFIYQ